ncbi:MAG: hypothetical protein KBT02_00240 [Treponema sp.]|nr:hypothetical protein [Candidatus Treponema caballi]
MSKKKLKNYTKGLLLTVLMLQVISCATTKKETEICYVVPEIDWPDFPKLADGEDEVDFEKNTVTVSLEWFIELAEFKEEYKGVRQYVDKVRGGVNGL